MVTRCDRVQEKRRGWSLKAGATEVSGLTIGLIVCQLKRLPLALPIRTEFDDV